MVNTCRRWAIYRISSKLDSIDDTYIGCTQNFTKRRRQHISNSRHPTDISQYVHFFINENGGISMWNINIIDNCKKIKTRQELFNLERRYIELYQPTLNCTIIDNLYNDIPGYNLYIHNIKLIDNILEIISKCKTPMKPRISLIDSTLIQIVPYVKELFPKITDKNKDSEFLNFCFKYLDTDKTDNMIKDWLYIAIKKIIK